MLDPISPFPARTLTSSNAASSGPPRRALVLLSLGLLFVPIAACSDDTTATSAVCGNGVLEPGEECESFDLRNQTCDALGLAIGQLRCSSTCTLDTTGCGGVCGDGIVQPGEACDGTNLNGATCASVLGAALG